MARKKDLDLQEVLSFININNDLKQKPVEQEVCRYDDELIESLADSLLDLSLTSLENPLVKMMKELEFDISDQIENLNILENMFLYKILRLGELSMSMRFIKTYSKKMNEDSIMEKVYSSDLSKNVIKVLFERNKLSHQQLADAVGKKKSHLTNKMAELNKFDLINAEKKGREKWYTLTGRGRRFYIRFIGNQSNFKDASISKSYKMYNEIFENQESFHRDITVMDLVDVHMNEDLDKEMFDHDFFNKKVFDLSIPEYDE